MIATKFIAARALYTMAIAVLWGIFSLQASAQQLYRIVGPDGKVTFSDTPPAAAANAKVTAGRGGRVPADNSDANAILPVELRGVANKYPVTLYTSQDCGPCASGRSMLQARGIPFTEKTVNSQQDVEAFQRLSGDNSLPMASIGSQQLKGYSDQEWSQYLDAAGYPKTSQLPANFRSPAASPMVARVTVPAAGAAAGPETAAARAGAVAPAPAPAAAPAPANPAGIKF